MDVVVGIVLLILAAAVVLLFAMFGELASRVGDGGGQGEQGGRWPGLRPLEDARIGAEPSSWPRELSAVPGAERAVVLALSTSCKSCQDVAKQVAQDGSTGLAIALACPTEEAGRTFVTNYGLAEVPHYLDETGSWLRSQFQVQSSPVGMVFHRGKLASASVFADLKALTR